jgi:hypothetical protein
VGEGARKENRMTTIEMVKARQDAIVTKLNAAAEELAPMNTNDFGHWVSYLLMMVADNVIDKELAEERLEHIAFLLKHRLDTGRWR